MRGHSAASIALYSFSTHAHQQARIERNMDVALDFARNHSIDQDFMSLLPILRFPDPRLKKLAAPVRNIDDSIIRLSRDMAETMYEAPGIGLAATQVDVHQQVIVIDVSDTHDQLLTLINPEIVESEGEQVCEEGCLSVPGIHEKVERAARVVVRYLDLEGRERMIESDGLLAVCLQHEIEHLKGKVFVEHLSQLKQMRIKIKFAKQAKITA
jgi:peptide deformylase